MTSSDRELARYTGEPYMLVDISRNYQRFQYTDADRDIVWSGDTYASTAMGVAEIEQNQQVSQNMVGITVPGDNPAALLFRVRVPSEKVMVRIYLQHYGETDASLEWTGRIATVVWAKEGTARLNCEPTNASVKRSGLRIRYQPGCPYTFGDSECGIDLQGFRQAGTVTTVQNATISSPAFVTTPDGQLAGGFIEWEEETGIIERRFITSHSGQTIVLDQVLPGLIPGMPIAGFWGCPLTRAGCKLRGNLLQYGGTPNIPTINPMGNSPIF